MRAVHYGAGRLVIPMGGQAVHEQRVILGMGHQGFVHLIGAQLVVAAFAGRLRIMHGNPCIGHNQIGPRHGGHRIAHDIHIHALGAGFFDKSHFRVQRGWAGKHQIKAELPGSMGKAGKDVIAIATPDHLFTGDRAAMFFVGQDVGHDLTGVGAVGQPVDDRNAGIFRHFQQGLFLEGADHDQVHIARQHAGGIGDGFAVAQLHIGTRQHHRLPPHLPHAHIKADARPGRGFFKDQRDHVVF